MRMNSADSIHADDGEPGPEIRAMVERAAAAINHDVGRRRQVLRPILEVIKALLGRGSSVIDGSGNMCPLIERVKADAYDDGPAALGRAA